jgi:heme-degrading monooxygenase HmoA
MFRTLRLPVWLIVTVSCLMIIFSALFRLEAGKIGDRVLADGFLSQNLPAQVMVARLWHGRTSATKADEYTHYLYELGIKKIRSINGNLGAEVLRRVDDNIGEFYVISYWSSREVIRQFAGNDIDKTHHLPRDPEFLLELEPHVRHFDVLVHEGQT